MKETDTRALKKMFDLLNISSQVSFKDFLAAEFSNLKTQPWYLKEPISITQRLGKFEKRMVKVRNRPRVYFMGKQDVVYKQLYRYFIGELPQGRLKPTNGKEDYNPWHWTANGVVNPNPTTVTNMAPKALDPELQDLVELIKQRQAIGGFDDVWEGVDEIYSPVEIAQVREFLNVD